MLFKRYFSRQLARPSGLFGRWFMARWLDRANASMNSLTIEQLALGNDDRLLEIGFGGGALLARVLREQRCAFAAGIDISPAMVDRAERRFRRQIAAGRSQIGNGAIEAIPYGDGEFSCLCSVNTLYFWPAPGRALGECRRVLKHGGRLTLTFNDQSEMERWPGHVHGFTLYTVAEVETLLAAAGFSAIRTVSDDDPVQGRFHCASAVAA